MKKMFIKSAALFAAAVMLLTGCNETGVSLDTAEDVTSASEDSSQSPAEAPKADEESKEASVISSESETEKTASEESSSESLSESTSKEEATKSDETVKTEETVNTEANAASSDSETKDASETQTSPPVTTAAVRTSAEPEASAAPAETKQNAANTGALSASCDIPSTWQENGSFCGTCQFTVTNGGGRSIDEWTVKLTVPNGFNVTSSWNGKFKLDGSTLTVDNEAYNGVIESGGKADFGFNFSSPSEFKPPYSITVNGIQTTAESGTAASEENETPASEAKPLPAPSISGLVKEHGKLSVQGTQLVDKNGNNFQLKGMSTHGLSWFPAFVNKDAFKTLRDDWNTNVIRLAMYTAESGGYCSGGSPSELKALVDKGVQAASELGMYVIIDWHILSDGNPRTNKAEAIKFFDEMSLKYKNYDNVIYEICNEPNGGASWDGDIKPYAEEVIAVIRKNAPDSVVIVGTPTWSQDIDKAAANPLKEKNVLYALHFYAATHTDWLRQRLTDCYNKGLPVFVSEFGTCDASGNGSNDFGQTKQWLELLDKYGISYVNWNLANKNETSSAFKESAPADGSWSANDLSEGGAWIRKWFRGEN